MRRTARSASMADVAALAGVSVQTVSRVSMGLDNVRPATRQKVLAAMEELGYMPNRAARALRLGSFGTIGLIVHGLARTGEARIVEAVVEAARDRGFTVTIVDVERPSSDNVGHAALRLRDQAVDGLIVVRTEDGGDTELALPHGLPACVSDVQLRGNLPLVGADDAEGTRHAVRHLLDLGHHTVHHVAGPSNSGPARIRLESWRAALTAAGRPVPDHVPGDWTAGGGYEAGLLLAHDPEVTAVYCANDETAIGVLRAFHHAGRRVPDDVSVVGFDGIAIGEQTIPPLTTVYQDWGGIGRRLVDLLFRQLDGADMTGAQETVPTRLVVRASTAPPRPDRAVGRSDAPAPTPVPQAIPPRHHEPEEIRR